MIQAILAYCIVAVAAAWLVWTLFLPGSLKGRLRPAARARPGLPGDCGSCAGCPPVRRRVPVPPREADRDGH